MFLDNNDGKNKTFDSDYGYYPHARDSLDCWSPIFQVGCKSLKVLYNCGLVLNVIGVELLRRVWNATSYNFFEANLGLVCMRNTYCSHASEFSRENGWPI